ncbi:glutaredoxin 2 [Pasteurellaceae bacterium LIM206]|nr:glutaredoxin 2 [Pasteurellaceae bacterium LIM206]
MKLYVYDHCPFCVRARMIFGLKNVPFEKIVLANDDDDTPVRLIGKKVVPILEKAEGVAMPESLDIVRFVDENCGDHKILAEQIRENVNEWMQKVGPYYNHLLLPRFVQLGLEEFRTESAVRYFESKKSASIGSFSDNLARTSHYLAQLTADLAQLENLIVSSTAASGQLSYEDIMLFPMLRNLTCVKGLQFPPKVRQYVTTMSEQAQVPLYTEKAV